MEISVSQRTARVPVTVFHVKGEITVESHGLLQEQADAAVEAGTRDLLLDLQGVPYISSAGLRAIHYIHTLLRGVTPEESKEAVSEGLRAGTYTSAHLKLLKPNNTNCLLKDHLSVG
jgi:anti-anti-sigma factor